LFKAVILTLIIHLAISFNAMSGSGNEEATRTEQDQQVSSSEAGEASTEATQQSSADSSSASGSENQNRRSTE
jgi:hypothetical protein